MRVLVEKIFELNGRSSYFHRSYTGGRFKCSGYEVEWPENVFMDEFGNPTDDEDGQSRSHEPRSEKWAYKNKWSYKRKFSESTEMSAIMESYGGIQLGPSREATARITNNNRAQGLYDLLMSKPGQGASFSLSKFWKRGSAMAYFLLLPETSRTHDPIGINGCTITDEFGGPPVGGKTGYGMG